MKGRIQLLLQNGDFGTLLNEGRKEGKKEGRRKTNKILTERANEPRTNDCLIDLPFFVREVETLLKGRIQLLLQNKDIWVPN